MNAKAYDKLLTQVLEIYFKTLYTSKEDEGAKRFACAQQRYLVLRDPAAFKTVNSDSLRDDMMKFIVERYLVSLKAINYSLMQPIPVSNLDVKLDFIKYVEFDKAVLVQQLRELHSGESLGVKLDATGVRSFLAENKLPYKSTIAHLVQDRLIKVWVGAIVAPIVLPSLTDYSSRSSSGAGGWYMLIHLLSIVCAVAYTLTAISTRNVRDHILSTISADWESVYRDNTTGNLQLLGALRDIFDRWPVDTPLVDFQSITPEEAYKLISYAFDSSAPTKYALGGFITQRSMSRLITALKPLYVMK